MSIWNLISGKGDGNGRNAGDGKEENRSIRVIKTSPNSWQLVWGEAI